MKKLDNQVFQCFRSLNFCEGMKRRLSEERIALLEKIGFKWDAQQAKWDAKYMELARHVEVNGPGTVPGVRSNPNLHYWVGNQKKEYRKMMKGEHTQLAGKRKEMLDELGFPWPTDV